MYCFVLFVQEAVENYTNGVNMQLNAYFQLFRQLKSVNNKR